MISLSWQMAELPYNSHLGTATGWPCQGFSGTQDHYELHNGPEKSEGGSVMQRKMERSLHVSDVSSVMILQNTRQR